MAKENSRIKEKIILWQNIQYLKDEKQSIYNFTGIDNFANCLYCYT